MKKTLSTILLGASLIFGAGNKTVGQTRENVEYYNHDNDKFPEEIIGERLEGFNETTKRYSIKKFGFIIIYYSDKDNDDFYENIKIINCKNWIQRVYVEDFYIDKNTGLIDYSWKNCKMKVSLWNDCYYKISFKDIVKKPSETEKHCKGKSWQYLTKQDIERGLAERIKKLINTGASGNQDEIKKLVEIERKYFRNRK